MKTFIAFVYDALGFFFAPKRTVGELSAHYKPALLPLGFTLSLVSILSLSVSSGVTGGWSPSTIFFYMASSYLGQFLFISVILSLISLFNGPVNAKSFWGLIFAADIILVAVLPLVLIGTALPFSIGFLTSIVGLWAAIVKLFIIQKTIRAHFSKALILMIAPGILLVLWLVAGVVILADSMKGMMSAFYY